MDWPKMDWPKLDWPKSATTTKIPPRPFEVPPSTLKPPSPSKRGQSTSANFDFGQLFFPISANSTSANFDFGQFSDVGFWIKKERKKKENSWVGQSK